MLGWVYQLLLSLVTRVLSWFGLSFGVKDVADAVEVVNTLHQQKDEPQEPLDQQGPVAYSTEETPQASP